MVATRTPGPRGRRPTHETPRADAAPDANPISPHATWEDRRSAGRGNLLAIDDEGNKGAGQTQAKKKPPAKKTTKSKTLNIVTTFENPWKGNLKKEIEAIAGGRWAPSSDDFAALVPNSFTVKHFHELIGVIIQQPKGSIGRINIFTHSNPDLIAFKGDINPQTTHAEVLLEIDSALSLEMLEQLTEGTWFQVGKSKKKHTMKDVRERFSEDASVYFYSCKSATDKALLQEFADKFDVIAVGFKKNIAYCPSYNISPPSIDRKHVGLGGCQNTSADFTAIDQHGVKRKPK